MSPLVVGGIASPIPFAPVLESPANAAFADLAGTPEFTWAFQAGVAGHTQSAWALRRKVAGASSYLYWNAGTSAWQSSLVWNSGSVTDVTFPSGAWPDGYVYNWSVATQDISGTGPWAADDTITAQAPPSVTVVTPSGITATATPTVQWTPSIPAGATQTAYWVRIFSAAQYGATGFDPGSSEAVWDSTLTGSAYADSVVVGTALADFSSYRVYVQITETGGQTSPWTYAAFTTFFAQPATPGLTAVSTIDPDTDSPSVVLIVLGADNLFSAADALTNPGPGTMGSWTVTSGSASMVSGKLTTTGSTILASGRYSVTPGDPYAAGLTAAITGGGSQGSYGIAMTFYSAAGATLENFTSATTTTGTAASVTGTAPAGASYVVIFAVITPGSSTKCVVSDAALGPSTGVGIFGGFAGNGFASISYSDDEGETWYPVRGGQSLALALPAQSVTVTDSEAPPGFTRLYAAVVTSGSATSNAAEASCTPTSSLYWWIKDPLVGDSLTVSLQPGTLEDTSNDRQQLYQVLGRPDPVVLSDAFELPSLQLTLIFISDANYQEFESMRARQHILLMQGPHPAGQWYVRMGATKQDSTNLKSLRTYTTSNGQVVRTVTLTCQAVAAP